MSRDVFKAQQKQKPVPGNNTAQVKYQLRKASQSITPVKSRDADKALTVVLLESSKAH
jgi:hypothetical protein